MTITRAPGFLVNLLTFRIALARWIGRTNTALGQGGAGALFAYFFAPFAYYGLAQRLNAALATQGSRLQVSPFMCFFFGSFPFIGARKRLGRAADALIR